MHLVVPVSLALQHASQAHPACSPLPFGGVQRGGLTPPVGTETAASDGAAATSFAAAAPSISWRGVGASWRETLFHKAKSSL